MNILIVGSPEQQKEATSRFGGSHQYRFHQRRASAAQDADAADLIMDFYQRSDDANFDLYRRSSAPLLVNSTTNSLRQILLRESLLGRENVFGFNGITSFLSHTVMEICTTGDGQELTARNLFQQLGVDFLIVDDRVGMVTPRIICMIINEAYWTVQEGTATRGDIDVAMKLGTNYPYGPFEWVERIGVEKVYELLTSLYDDTRDDRFKVCPLLKQEYLSSGKVFEKTEK